MAYGVILTVPCPDCHRKPGQAYCGAACASEPPQKGPWGVGRLARLSSTPEPVPAAVEAPEALAEVDGPDLMQAQINAIMASAPKKRGRPRKVRS